MPATPPLSPGLTFVEQPARGALHRFVLDADCEGTTLWVDARGAASTCALIARAGRYAMRGVRIARAFTAHQHHGLVRRVVEAASPRTGLVVAPDVAALYDAADAADAEIDRLFDATLALLAALAAALGLPVVVTAPGASADRRVAVRERATETVECRETDLGYAYATDTFQTTGYWRDGWWQTTVPYWVEVCGAVAARDPATVAEFHRQATALE